MTYEEKLEKIIYKLKEERELTRKGYKTTVSFNDRSFTKLRIGDICKILLKLQDDEKIVKITEALQPIETVSPEQIIKPSKNDNYEDVDIIEVEIGEKFDDWYRSRLQKSQQAIRPTTYQPINELVVTKATAEDIVKEFSIKNRVYVASILEEILSCSDFADDEIYYQTTSLGGQRLINERMLVKKLGSLGLYRYIGEEDIGGSIRLRGLDKKLTQEVIDLLRTVEEDHSIVVADVSTKSVAEWSDSFRWEDSKFVFGTYGSTKRFTSNVKRKLFNKLVEANGKWVELSILRKLTDKDNAYLRVTIGQINNSWDKSLKNHVTLISTDDDNLQPKPQNGAYRIKILEKSL